MSLGFEFDTKIDTSNSKDPSDLPPEGWDTSIDTRNYSAALFGFPSELFTRCCEWEKRELERLHQ